MRLVVLINPVVIERVIAEQCLLQAMLPTQIPRGSLVLLPETRLLKLFKWELVNSSNPLKLR